MLLSYLIYRICKEEFEKIWTVSKNCGKPKKMNPKISRITKKLLILILQKNTSQNWQQISLNKMTKMSVRV